MQIAVLDVDINKMPTVIKGLRNCAEALILLRIGNKPVGQIYVPVKNERIIRGELIKKIERQFGDRIYLTLLEELSLNLSQKIIINDKMPKATVAVITRDRPNNLRRCIDALMKLPDDGQEFLVIDNCPKTDDTKHIVANFGGRLRYVRENHPGASAARNRALREAKHEIVAFTDDDALPDTNWLRALLSKFNDPLVLCVTGLVMPLRLDTEAQKWFEVYSSHGRGFKRLIFDCTSHDVMHVAPIGVSANMALRKSIVENVGYFDEALGPGTKTLAGEDYELFSRILTYGYRIVYEPSALSWHCHRRTWQELRKIIYGYGVAVYSFWTKSLINEKELRVLRLAWLWFFHKQLPNLIRSISRRPDRMPLDLIVAELCGCLNGPLAYLISRRRNKHRSY